MQTILMTSGKTEIKVITRVWPDGTIVIDLPHVMDLPIGGTVTFTMGAKDGIIRDHSSRYHNPFGRITLGRRNRTYSFALSHAAGDRNKRYWINLTPNDIYPPDEAAPTYLVSFTYRDCITDVPSTWNIGPFTSLVDANGYVHPDVVSFIGVRYHFDSRTTVQYTNQSIFGNAATLPTFQVSSCFLDGTMFASIDDLILSYGVPDGVGYADVDTLILSKLGSFPVGYADSDVLVSVLPINHAVIPTMQDPTIYEGTLQSAAIVATMVDPDLVSSMTLLPAIEPIVTYAAASLTGSQYLNIPGVTGSTSFNITDYDGVAISVWFKPTGSPNSACIFNFSNPGNTSAFACYQAGGSNPNQLIFQWRYGTSGGSVNTVVSDTMVVGTWYHLLLTSGNYGTKAYINGIEKVSFPTQTWAKASDMFLNFGYLNSGSPGYYAIGQMAFAALYNRYIWPEEAAELGNADAAMSWDAMPDNLRDGCVAFYELANWTGHTGSELVDMTGTRANAQTYGTITYAQI